MDTGDKGLQRLQGAVLPAGVNITTALRCGDADRARTADRIKDAYAHGFLEQHEAEARLEALSLATLAAQLDQLTADLPAMSRFRRASLPVRKPKPLTERWAEAFQDHQPWSALGTFMLAWVVAVPPGLTLNLLGDKTAGVVALATGIPLGVVLLIGAIGSLIEKYD